MFAWSEDYRIGFAPIDAQHRRLFDVAARLETALAAGAGAEVLAPALASLADYTETHFATEERFMRRHHYPGLRVHQVEHQALTARVMELQRTLQEEGPPATRVLQLLKVWLVHHIGSSDRRAGTWCTARALPPCQASSAAPGGPSPDGAPPGT